MRKDERKKKGGCFTVDISSPIIAVVAHLIAICRLTVRSDDLTPVGHLEAAVIALTRARPAGEVVGLAFQDVNFHFLSHSPW